MSCRALQLIEKSLQNFTPFLPTKQGLIPGFFMPKVSIWSIVYYLLISIISISMPVYIAWHSWPTQYWHGNQLGNVLLLNMVLINAIPVIYWQA